MTGTTDEVIASSPDHVWSCQVPTNQMLHYHEEYRVSNVRTLAHGAELRILSPESPMEGAVQEETTLEDVFLSYFGEKSGDTL